MMVNSTEAIKSCYDDIYISYLGIRRKIEIPRAARAVGAKT